MRRLEHAHKKVPAFSLGKKRTLQGYLAHKKQGYRGTSLMRHRLEHAHKKILAFLLGTASDLSDTIVYEPSVRTRLGTSAHLCEVVVIRLSPLPGEEGATAMLRNFV